PGHGRRNIRREVGRKMRLLYPPVTGAVRLERLGGLRHGLLDRRTALAVIKCKGGDVDQCRNLRIVAGFSDDGPAITVADDDYWPVHGVDGPPGVLDVLGVGGLGGLRYRYRVAIFLEDLGDGLPTRTVGKCAMHQHHILYARRRRSGNLLNTPRQQNRSYQRGCPGDRAVKPFHGAFPSLCSWRFYDLITTSQSRIDYAASNNGSQRISRKRSAAANRIGLVLNVDLASPLLLQKLPEFVFFAR